MNWERVVGWSLFLAGVAVVAFALVLAATMP